MSDELRRALDSLEVPLHDKVYAIFKGTLASKALVEQVVSVIQGMLSRNAYEEAVASAYFRIWGWLKSLEKLNEPVHVQAVFAAARSIFELLLDLKLLVENEACADKFHDFVFVERFRIAKLTAAFADEHFPGEAEKADHERTFISTQTNIENLEMLCRKHGWWDEGRGKPIKRLEHWSGKNVPDRAKHLGAKYEEMYRNHYGRLSWNIHAGAVGLGGMSARGIEAGFGDAHRLIQDMVYDATETVASTFKLFDADEALRQKIRSARDVLAVELRQVIVRALEQQQD